MCARARARELYEGERNRECGWVFPRFDVVSLVWGLATLVGLAEATAEWNIKDVTGWDGMVCDGTGWLGKANVQSTE